MEIDMSGIASYGVKVKNFTVTRSQAIRIYAVLIVIAVCESRNYLALLTTQLSALSVRDRHDDVPVDLCDIGVPREGHQD